MMKTVIKRLARKFGFDVRRHVAPIKDRPFDIIALVIEHFVRTDTTFRFLQVGAFDGTTGDPIHAAVVKHDLCGILVEPNPDAFQKLTQTYAGRNGLVFENCAIASQDGLATLYRFKPGSPLPEWTQQVTSFNETHLKSEVRAIENANDYIESLAISATSIDTLKKKHSLTSLGLLQIDTEGFDFEIIKMAFAAKLYPNVLNYEHVHLSHLDQQSCRQLLATNGYRYITVGKDTLAVRDDHA